MAIIDTYRGILTIFIEFKTKKADAQVNLEKLKSLYNDHFNGSDGLISVNYHLSKDEKTIFNYTQWKNEETYDCFMSDPLIKEVFSSLDDLKPKFTKTKVVFTS